MKTLIGAGEECNEVYVFRGVIRASAHNIAAKSSGGRDLWHRRLGHPSSRILSYLLSYVDVGKPAHMETVCDTCFRAKHTRDCFQESYNKAAELFGLIHCDIWGPYRTVSSSGASYFLTIVDDFSRAVWIYLLREKREVASTIEKFCAMVDRQFDKKVKILRSDNGLEFMCLKPFLEKEGMLHQTSCVYTPQKNGRMERKHRHILNVSRSIMFQAHLPIQFWGECVLAEAHLINRTPLTLLNGKTQYELLYNEPLPFSKLKVFGCLCYAHNVSRDKDKFGERSRRCVFVGYPNGHKAWRVFDLETEEYFFSRDVVFHENEFPFSSPPKATEALPIVSIPETWDDDFEKHGQLVTTLMEIHEPTGGDVRGSSEETNEVREDNEVRGVLMELT
ncbi:unnamed protein product [Microthlaspi erraticum]|uniref:Integrase catalytic domain-containing protein n=1 Tax=Microthlaspi erraticum TaxID=1685480 RepID=A0A6D2L938_9BRAS|nr:unnamed protein product [Microthlaspi erraticum]